MVEERAMSTVKWINTARRNRQEVSTVADSLIIRNFLESTTQDAPTSKPTTVNWRDIHKTIRNLAAQSRPIPNSRPQAAETRSTSAVPNDSQETDSAHNSSGNIVDDVPSEDDELPPINPDSSATKHDPLRWLDDGLPEDLSSSTQLHFLLEEEFDIERYLDILADGPPISTTLGNLDSAQSTHETQAKKSSLKDDAAGLAPDNGPWDAWD
jgi:hypothetical protein